MKNKILRYAFSGLVGLVGFSFSGCPPKLKPGIFSGDPAAMSRLKPSQDKRYDFNKDGIADAQKLEDRVRVYTDMASNRNVDNLKRLFIEFVYTGEDKGHLDLDDTSCPNVSEEEIKKFRRLYPDYEQYIKEVWIGEYIGEINREAIESVIGGVFDIITPDKKEEFVPKKQEKKYDATFENVRGKDGKVVMQKWKFRDCGIHTNQYYDSSGRMIKREIYRGDKLVETVNLN